MPTLPRLCLFGFADYKQKERDVNGIHCLTMAFVSYFPQECSRLLKGAQGILGLS
jgi:hypothetical protein